MDWVNTRLLSHPVNWFVVLTVMLFLGFMWTLAHDRLANGPIVAQT